MDIYSLTVLDARNSEGTRSLVPSRGSEGSMTLSQLLVQLQLLTVPGIPWFVHASPPPLPPSAHGVLPIPKFPSFYEDACCYVRSTLIQYDLILS